MENTIKSGVAMLNVLESWGVDHLYGIPGGSINSLMDALWEKRDTMKYIQVRHEEVGAMAAAADAKLTGKIGVCFGSAGPGATHLFNGLYDAQMDRVPVLALIGQVVSGAMNTDAFQEMNENPMLADVAVYNRTVMNPKSLPAVVDEAIRRAYEYRGVAVVTIPVDYGFADIADKDYSSARSHRTGAPTPEQKDIAAAVELIAAAERPVLYVGQGARGREKEILAFSEHFSMPIVYSVLAKGIVPEDTPNLLGSAGRLSTKPANEALPASDLIVFVGSNFPFANYYFMPEVKFIQVDTDSSRLGKRHRADAAILADAGEALKAMTAAGKKKAPGKWLEANRKNRQNWLEWLRGFETMDEVPMRPEPVFAQINRIAEPDAIFVTDVGNTTIQAVRLLKMNPRQRFTTSGLFATMGYGVPGGIAAKLSFPKRQVFTLSGDGAFAMVMQDIITQVRYRLPIINIVFSNDSLGFIDAEQEDTRQPKFGVDLTGADYAAIGAAMGARGFSVTRYDQLQGVFDEAKRSAVPVVIDVKITNDRPFPAEAMLLDEELYPKDKVDAFKQRYRVKGMPTLSELLKK